MVTIVETETFIRFQLDQLGAQNRHHEFENICFRIAKRRISSNILPATGPVSSGGDQGRDGETFFSALPEELPRAGGFVGRATMEPLVLACTIQRNDLSAKVKGDLKKITLQGQPVARIAYFIAQNMPVGTRHELQDFARQEHEVDLEIFDALAISSFLAEPDLVWVAEKMLDLPSNLVPTADQPLPLWYQDLQHRVRNTQEPPTSPGDFAAVRAGLRHATHQLEARQDLPEWLEFIQSFIDHDDTVPEDVQMKARYEIVVATLRGTDTLTNVESYIDEFIQYAAKTSAASDLQDASALLSYWQGAWAAGIATTTSDHLMAQLNLILQRVDGLIAETDRDVHPNAAAHLLAARAHILFHPDVTGMVRTPGAPVRRADASDMTFEEILNSAGSAEELKIQLDPLMATLSDLAELLPHARMFPVQTTSDLFEAFSPVLAAHRSYEEVRNALDVAIGSVEGDNAVAERCRSRALSLFHSGKPILALREFHKAKINWFHGDTLRGSVLAMLTISSVYSGLKLHHAAKKYSLTAASIAVSSQDSEVLDLVGDSLIQAFSACYSAGAWLDATAFSQLALQAHGTFAENAFDHDQHPELVGLDFHQSTICMAARKFRPDLVAPLTAALSATDYDKVILAYVDQLESGFEYDETSFAETSLAELGGRPFSDTGPTRSLTFSALGTHWNITCSNDRATVLAAERFAAAAQMLLCELATEDPVLLEESVTVEIRLSGPQHKERVEFRPDNNHLSALVTLLPYRKHTDAEDLEHEILGAVGVLLIRLSALSQEQILDMLGQAFARGFLNNLSFGRPYDETAGLLDNSHYVRASEVGQQILSLGESASQPVEALKQPTSYGPGFSETEWREMIRERYEAKLISFTLARVLRNTTCRGILSELRDEGWLDWHLLLAIFNVATNYRVRQELGSSTPSPAHFQQVSQVVPSRIETSETPNIPLHHFSKKALQDAFGLATLSVAKRLGLHIDRDTPNIEGVRHLLDRRYGFMQDVPHPDLLLLP
ncbi:hypothetical protein [Paenarthrobacter nitroguajacolicus]|uniref:hypothetical protein n=1 Tax=Paenarthrobacter nitroguajacolicus TaxID=211146 RepID=UPI000AE89B33|nr:hypothetical protein [Paenarthrobacter nitroguajacolicus]